MNNKVIKTAHHIILMVTLCISNTDGFACKCKELSLYNKVDIGLKDSDIIFLGELLPDMAKHDTFFFEIFEIYKGDYKSSMISGRKENMCSFHPIKPGIYLIYANFQPDSLIYVSSCGPSVYYKNPSRSYPANPNFFEDSISLKNIKSRFEFLNNKMEGITDWDFQLNKLRHFKNSNRAKQSAPGHNYQLIALIFSVFLNLMFLTVVIKVTRNASRQHRL